MRVLWFITATVLLGTAGLRAAEGDIAALSPADGETWEIETKHLYVYDDETRTLIATNGVTIRYGPTTLTASNATLNDVTGDVEAEGNVRLDRYGALWTGEVLRYNLVTGQMSGEGFRTGNPPYFASGEVLVADQAAGVYVLADGKLTTDDYAPPSYYVGAKSLVVVPGEYVEARHATLRLGKVPVMYFPYFRRSLKARGNRFHVTPGYRSSDGLYLLNRYDWYAGDRLEGSVHLDGRMKRGVGGGPDFKWNDPRLGQGGVQSYYFNDSDPGLDSFDDEIGEDRYRVNLGHLASPRTNMTVRGVLRYQSDSEVVRDFFESEFRDNVQPNSFLEVHQTWRNFSLDVLAQPQVNDFYETVERLPDVQFSAFRQPLGRSPLYYESQSGAGWYQRRFANDLTNRFHAARADSYHELSLPRTLFNWLNVAPRLGGRFTHYEEAGGPGGVTTERDRWVAHAGAEATAKASRTWPGVRHDFWEIDGVRHLFEPSLNYAFIPDPSPGANRLPQFDYLVPNSVLLPIDFPDNSSIDAIDEQNVLRFGLRNRLQTKRDGLIDNLLHWAVFLDWNLHPEGGRRTYSNLYSDLDVKPFSWLTFTSQNQYDLNDSDWRQVANVVTVTPNNRWSASVGQRYFNQVPLLGPDSTYSLWFGSLYYRVNENWGLRLSQRYNSDNDLWEEQQYTLYRDLRSWTSALTVRVRKDEDGPTDYTAAVTFSLKTFPRFGLDDDVNRPSRLLGY